MPRLQLLGRFLPQSLACLAVLLGSTLPALAAAGPNAAQLQALETALNGTGELRGAMEDGPGLDVTLVELRWRSSRFTGSTSSFGRSPAISSAETAIDGDPCCRAVSRSAQRPTRFRFCWGSTP